MSLRKSDSDKTPLECTDAQNNTNRVSEYARADIVALRKRLAALEIDSRREVRLRYCECPRCHYLRTGGTAGQAFTYRDCDECGESQSFATTATKKICTRCASRLHLCRECGGDLEMEQRDELVQPRGKPERAAWWAAQQQAAVARAERIHKKRRG